MIVQTLTMTGKIQEEEAEPDDEISNKELADPLYIETTNYEKPQ